MASGSCSRDSKLFYDLTKLMISLSNIAGYATQNIHVPLAHYDALEAAIVNYTSSNGLVLRGEHTVDDHKLTIYSSFHRVLWVL